MSCLQEDDTQEGYRALVSVKDAAKGKVMQVRRSRPTDTLKHADQLHL